MTLNFNCKPHRYIKAGTWVQALENGQILLNNWDESLPLIQITGSGSGVLTVGGITVTIDSMDGSLTLDAETQNAYSGLENKTARSASPAASFRPCPPVKRGLLGAAASLRWRSRRDGGHYETDPFPSTATEFKTQGLGVLTDAISCTVTEERNGAFELTMQYPDTGVHFDEITDRCIIYAIPSPYRAPQPFRIYRITRPMDGIIMVYAQHITYDLSGVPLNPFTAINAPDALSKLSLNAAVDSPFTFWTDKATVASFAVSTPSSTRSVLGGSSGSILDVYGGEYEWDGFTVRLYGHRGYDNGVVISYGKNLTDIEQDRNISNVATGIYPYWTNAEGALVTCDPKIVNAPGTYDLRASFRWIFQRF